MTDKNTEQTAGQLENMHGAAQAVRALEDLGVTTVFGYPGAAVVDLYDAIYDSRKITHYLCRHEQGAVHMADGYARSTGQAGVALVTSGPGATNTVTAIATAYMDSIPLVIITGQVSTNLIGSDAFQEVDTIGVTRPVVKYSFLCKRPEDVTLNIRKAFYIATTGRKGPVVVDIPKNCQDPRYLFPYEPNSEIHLRSYNPTVFGHKGQVKRAAKALSEARRPVLLFGGGVIQAGACAELRKLAEITGIPVACTLMGISGFPSADPHFLGMVGLHGLYEANLAMHHSDLVFTVAVRFDDRVTNNVQKFCPEARVVHIDVDPASISKCVHADIPIVGDAKAVLTQLLETYSELGLGKNPELDGWWQQIYAWKARSCLSYTKIPGQILPQQVMEAINELTAGRDDVYITTDVGQHQMFAAQFLRFAAPRHFITSGGLGTMGFGFPAAAGVKKAFPEATVICITGDGSFQMNLQELSTCAQYGLYVKVIILNNHTLGMVRQFQNVFYHARHAATDLDFNPDFVKLADAYGHVGLRAGQDGDLKEVLQKAMAINDRLVIVDVPTAADSLVLPWQRGGSSMDDLMLEADTGSAK